MSERVPIRRLPMGVPGLDAVLGGGVPEFTPASEAHGAHAKGR